MRAASAVACAAPPFGYTSGAERARLWTHSMDDGRTNEVWR
jgi:hypothetical protein